MDEKTGRRLGSGLLHDYMICLTEDCNFERAYSEQGTHCVIILLSIGILLHGFRHQIVYAATSTPFVYRSAYVNCRIGWYRAKPYPGIGYQTEVETKRSGIVNVYTAKWNWYMKS